MKRTLCAALIATLLATPALGARLYLKDGGVIQAKRVWRSDGKVYVLATRDTMTSFEPYEVNLKRTFPPKPKQRKAKAVPRRVGAVRPAKTAASSRGEAATPQRPEEKKPSFRLPSLPTLPEKSPESLVPSSGSGGSIKKHKKEMAEQLGE